MSGHCIPCLCYAIGASGEFSLSDVGVDMEPGNPYSHQCTLDRLKKKNYVCNCTDVTGRNEILSDVGNRGMQLLEAFDLHVSET